MTVQHGVIAVALLLSLLGAAMLTFPQDIVWKAGCVTYGLGIGIFVCIALSWVEETA